MSAKTAEGINETFDTITKKVIQKRKTIDHGTYENIGGHRGYNDMGDDHVGRLSYNTHWDEQEKKDDSCC